MQKTSVPVHSLTLRVTHWLNAFAVFVMIFSGWRIYNASPIFDFVFPPGFTLGGWLAGALAWHFAAMWLFALNGLVYLAHGFASGHFRAAFALPPPAAPRRDPDELPGAPSPGRYSAAQRLVYIGVILVLILTLLSGLAIWKPVQLQGLTAFFGGYDTARIVHFYAMTAIVAFVTLHVSLALRGRGLVAAMITGRMEVGR